MKGIRKALAVMLVFPLGSLLSTYPGWPVAKLSLIDVAHAARPAVHRGAHRTAHRTVRPHRGRTSVDVDVRGRGGYRRDVDVDVERRGPHRSVDVDVDVRRRPYVGGVAAGIAIGTRIATLPRGCTTVVTYGVTYYHCGGVYYRPYYHGTSLVYVVVEAP